MDFPFDARTEELRTQVREFMDEFVHPRTGVKYHDVLNGGGLTNRPFLKGIAPVNLSELFAAEGDQMDPKALRAALGLKEDASDAEVMKPINNFLSALSRRDKAGMRPHPFSGFTMSPVSLFLSRREMRCRP